MAKRINKTPAAAPKSSPGVFQVELREVVQPSINLTQLQYTPNNWVNYGDLNLWPNFLIELVSYSTVHQSFLNKKAKMIRSEGLSYSDNVAPFLENINEEGDTADDLLKMASKDLSVLETMAIVVRYNKLKTKIVALDYLDSSKVRVDKNIDLLTGRTKGYWVSADWSNLPLNPPVYYEKFNPRKPTSTTQIFFGFEQEPGNPFYPMVSYAAAISYILTAKELGTFNLNDIHNGFFGSALLSIQASMTDEQKAQFTNKIKSNFTGAENASKLLISVSEDINNISLTPLQTADNADKVVTRREICVSEIASAHRGNPIIAGINMDGNALTSEAKMIRDANEYYYNEVIRDLQLMFLNFLHKVLEFNGHSDYTLEVATSPSLIERHSLSQIFIEDHIKPEVLLAGGGYTQDQFRPEVLDSNGEINEDAGDINEQPGDTSESPAI